MISLPGHFGCIEELLRRFESCGTGSTRLVIEAGSWTSQSPSIQSPHVSLLDSARLGRAFLLLNLLNSKPFDGRLALASVAASLGIGDRGSMTLGPRLRCTIVDTQGISSIVFGRHLRFDDAALCSAYRHLGLVGDDRSTLRLGVTGAPSVKAAQGGDAIELTVFSQGGESAESLSCYGETGELGASTLFPLDQGQNRLRFAYSQCALASPSDDGADLLTLRFTPTRFLPSLLSTIFYGLDSVGLGAYGAITHVCPTNGSGVIVRGRVPTPQIELGWRNLGEAERSGAERQFCLREGQDLFIVGTRYARTEPDWTSLARSAYQSHGHFHAIAAQPASSQLAAFHLRGLALKPKSAAVSIHLLPATRVLRLFPLIGQRCAMSLRTVEEIVRLFPTLEA